jgi:hypothetical protein
MRLTRWLQWLWLLSIPALLSAQCNRLISPVGGDLAGSGWAVDPEQGAIFTSYVGWKADMDRGTDMPCDGVSNVYTEGGNGYGDHCPPYMSVFGNNTGDVTGDWAQSGKYPALFNLIGGMNTVAQMHDNFLMQTFGTVSRNPGI